MKPNRKAVYDKYNGHCAYCGSSIEFKEMQVDHVIPQWRCNDARYHVPLDKVHCHENYMPACRSCNNYKTGNPLEVFRIAIQNQIEVLRRDRPTFRLAERFGLIECKPKAVVFYFETVMAQEQSQ